MQYLSFFIEYYRAIKELTIDVSKERLIPLIGINECGKTTILQAIFCFDYGNDNYNGRRHLQDVANLYGLGGDAWATISAELLISAEEFKDAYTLYASKQDNSTAIVEQQTKIMEWWGEQERKLRIIRQLVMDEVSEDGTTAYKGKYVRIELDGTEINEKLDQLNIPTSDIDELARKILVYGPHILYSDDFSDRPADTIEIPDQNNSNTLTEWQSIYNTLFKQTPTEPLSRFSLHFVANEQNSSIQRNQLDHIQKTLNEELSEAFETFLPKSEQSSMGEFEIKLDIRNSGEANKKVLEIKVREKSNDASAKNFRIRDRSKGFVWYFNLVMKMKYNPKVYRQHSNSNSIFLLDEPGSYLHANAQAELCKKLKEMSEENGTVIYCTHTPHLLNPQSIATHKVRIVVKENNGIVLQDPDLIAGDRTLGPEKPLFEALHLPYFHAQDANKPCILVEGIYDAYTLRIFSRHFWKDVDPNIVPGSSAHSILELLPYFIGFQFKYVALWDNDEEGRKKQQRATEEFGTHEAKRLILLPSTTDNPKSKVKMETLFAKGDIQKIAKEFNISMSDEGSPKTLYKNSILALFSADPKKQKSIIESLSKETKQKITTLFTSIKSALEQ